MNEPIQTIKRLSITCISDLHGHIPKTLDPGDVLIIAGDLTHRDQEKEYFAIFDWIRQQPFDKKILIAGNHDNLLQRENYVGPVGKEFDYLCDSAAEYGGVKFWGSPWTKRFPGQNPKAMAFCVDSEADLANSWAKIPTDTDVLITHGPPHGILDRNFFFQMCGSLSLMNWIQNSHPRMKGQFAHIFGHIHECGGSQEVRHNCLFVNASLVDQNYRFAYAPQTIKIYPKLK